MFRNLHTKFQGRTELPIEVQDICDALVEMGWWNVALDDTTILAWVFGLMFWPLILFGVLAVVAVVLPIAALVVLGNYLGSKLSL